MSSTGSPSTRTPPGIRLAPAAAMILTPFQSTVVRDFGDRASRGSSVSPHAICIAPTGTGKGVIVEEILRDPDRGRAAIILVPLNALGRQTAARLRSRGIAADFLETGVQPKADVLVCGPERLTTRAFRDWFGNVRGYDLFVDEAHCLEDWGSGFRPAFRDLFALLRERRPERSLWLTATLPRAHRAHLERATGFEFRVHGRFALPPNLALRIERHSAASRFECLRTDVLEDVEPRIVFCNTRRETESWSRLATARGVPSDRYHAGLALEERAAMETRLRTAACSLLFATSAFGMGMDFGHLRASVVAAAPFSLLSLVQSIGRVGRASVAGRGLVLWAETDFRWNEYVAPAAPDRATDRSRLREFLELGAGEARAAYLAEYFL